MRQLNTKRTDIQDYRTNYGKHNRLVISMTMSERTLHVREDIQGIGSSGEEDRMLLIRKDYPQCRNIEFARVEFIRSSNMDKFYDSLIYTYTFNTRNDIKGEWDE